MNERRDCSPRGQPLRVAAVGADPAIAREVAGSLAAARSAWRVDAYSNGTDALKAIAGSPPHVVLMDINMPGISGVECTRRLRARLPQLPVVFLTASQEPGGFLRAMTAGACGYLLKPLPVGALAPHLHNAINGGTAFCAGGERLLLQALHGLACPTPVFGLTRREGELMLCLCRHRIRKETAKAMGVSEATVHAHLAQIFRKLGVHNREAAMLKFTAQLAGG